MFKKLFIIILNLILSGCSTQHLIGSTENNASPLNITIIKPTYLSQTKDYNSLLKSFKLGLKPGLDKGMNINLLVQEVGGDAEFLDALAQGTKGDVVVALDMNKSLTSAVTYKVEKSNIVFFTLSNHANLANRADNIFVVGSVPGQQAKYLLENFLKSYKHYVFLLPSDIEYRNLNSTLRDIVVEKEAILLRSEFYQNSSKSLNSAFYNINNTVKNLALLRVHPNKAVLYIASNNLAATRQIYDLIRQYNLDERAVILVDNNMDIKYRDNIKIHTVDCSENKSFFGERYIDYLDILAYDIGELIADNVSCPFSKEKFILKLNSKAGHDLASGTTYFVNGITVKEYKIVEKGKEQTNNEYY